MNAELGLVADGGTDVGTDEGVTREGADEDVVGAGVKDGGGQLLVKVLVIVMVVVGKVVGTAADDVAGVSEISIVNVVVVDWPAMTVIVAILASCKAMALTTSKLPPVISVTASAEAPRTVL